MLPDSDPSASIGCRKLDFTIVSEFVVEGVTGGHASGVVLSALDGNASAIGFPLMFEMVTTLLLQLKRCTGLNLQLAGQTTIKSLLGEWRH
jgi:hypothetical protein